MQITPFPQVPRFSAKSCHDGSSSKPPESNEPIGSPGERMFLLSKDNNPRVRHQVALVMRSLEDDDFKVMIIQELAQDQSRPVRRTETVAQVALSALPSIRKDNAKVTLLDSLLAPGQPIPHPKLLVEGALSIQEAGQRDPMLRKLLTHQDPALRDAASHTVKWMQPGQNRDETIALMTQDKLSRCGVQGILSISLIENTELRESLAKTFNVSPEKAAPQPTTSSEPAPKPSRLRALLARLFGKR